MAGQSNIRDLIVEEASALFAEKGYAGLSMRALAENVGVSKAAVYYYFSDKEQLFLDILLGYLEDFRHHLQQIKTEYGELDRQLLEIIRYIDLQSPAKKQLIWYLRNDIWQLSIENTRRLVQRYHHSFVDLIDDMFAEAIARGEIKAMDTKTLAWSFLGMVYPFVNKLRDAHQQENQWGVHVVEVFMDGVRPRN